MNRSLPPVVYVALAYAAGIALPLLGVSVPLALQRAGLLVVPVVLWCRPWPIGVLLATILSGVLSGEASENAERRDCRLHLPTRWVGQVEGRFLTRPTTRASVPFELTAGAPGDCRGTVRALWPSGAEAPPVGRLVRTSASWEGRAFPQPGWAERAGFLRIAADWTEVEGRRTPRGLALELRGKVEERILELWGAELAPMAEALVLARRDRLDPDLREAFARSGTAHLLAISGFHVGVFTVLLVGILRLVGLSGLRAEAGAVAGCWAYVLGIGAPSAAVRAGVILSLLLGARFLGRPVVAAGAIGSALLALLLVQPGWLGAVGFQLSFAGTVGLVLLRGSVAHRLDLLWRLVYGAALPARSSPGLFNRVLRRGADGAAAGVAATLVTLPLLAWHFDRVSIVGVPATLLVAPIITVAIPGIGASLLLSVLPGGFGAFLAGGTGVLLEAMTRVVTGLSALPGASIWVSREAIVGALLGGFLMFSWLRRLFPRRIRPSIRALSSALCAASTVAAIPLLPSRKALEMHLIDVGQGDAIALRSPSGRWLLVDAGPRSPGYDAGERRVVPYLRRHGASRLEALVLTHPHMDHIGGAIAVLREMDVRGVIDPSVATGSQGYLGVIEEVQGSSASWWPARAGATFELDGVRVHVVHAGTRGVPTDRVDDANDLSVVLLVEWRDVVILLTGDAPAAIERELISRFAALTVLKVGHHGSRTSTTTELMDRARPQVALIPVGDGNRFGHPHREVIERLEAAEVTVFRTDRDGDVRLVIRPDGSLRADSSR